MVMPSEQLNIAYFCEWFLLLLSFPFCFHDLFVFVFAGFLYVDKYIFSGSANDFDPPSNPEESPGLLFPCYTHGITRGLVLSQHGLYPNMEGNMN